MPLPFPGMNPYLEGHRWLGFHGDLCTEIRRQLAPKLAPRYFPDTTRYFVPESGDEADILIEQIIPDLGIAAGRPSLAPLPGGTMIAAPAKMHVAMPREVAHYRIDIRDMENHKLVTAIEFLSPTNKRSKGREKYLRKRNRLLESSAHLMEIDLLRKGKRPPMIEPYPPGEYFVLVSRAETRPLTDVWPIKLDQPLPPVPVPLLQGDPDVSLDLQQAVNNVYDLGRFDLRIDYKRPPDVPLTPEQEEWVAQQLRKTGLRE